MHPTPLPCDTHFEFNDLDRRAWPRFERRIRVLFLPEDCALDEPYGGWIVNGSRGGVRLAAKTAGIGEGAVLNLRLPKAGGAGPWVPVRVLNCSAKENEYELGCVFLRPVLQETATLFQ